MSDLEKELMNINIKLKKITLENFMNYGEKTFDFGKVTKISGKNGKGKTSILTAYFWLLFNCDYELHDNPKVRREINGVSVDDMDTSVTAVFDIDGKQVTAKKVQKRTYSKDKTSFKDDNKYFINDVPKTLKDFNDYFDVDMNVFKICSNVNAFLSKKPAEMREFLFGTIENVTDLNIAKENAELAFLIPLLEQHAREELEAMNKATKARITKELPVLDGQIKEKERDCTVVVDVAEMELCKNALLEQIERAEQSVNDNDKLYEEYQKISDEVMQLKLKQSDLQNKANTELEKKKAEIRSEKNEKLDYILKICDGIDNNKRKIAGYENDIESGTRERNRLAELWKSVNTEVFDDSTTICPTCHRELPIEEIQSLRSAFEKSKTDRLIKIEKDGMECKQDIENAKEMIPKLEECNKDNVANREKLEKEVEELEKQLLKLPQVADISSTTEYLELQKQIEEKEQLMNKSSVGETRQQLKSELSDLRNQLTDVEKQLAKADTTEDEKRLEQLRQNRLDMEQSKADCERVLYLLEQLDKFKNEKLTTEINSKFGIVDWKLFEFAKNGNYKSCCIPIVDGKSMLDISSNKGNRILGKLDICNSIQKISGLNCPVFADDMESLDSENMKKALEILKCQIVTLHVTNDELKVESEE